MSFAESLKSSSHQYSVQENKYITFSKIIGLLSEKAKPQQEHFIRLKSSKKYKIQTKLNKDSLQRNSSKMIMILQLQNHYLEIQRKDHHPLICKIKIKFILQPLVTFKKDKPIKQNSLSKISMLVSSLEIVQIRRRKTS